MINVISQSLGLDVDNINAYAKVYQNIPNGLRVIDIFHEQAGENIFTNCPVTKSKCLIIGHSMKVNLQFQLTLLGSCNLHIFYNTVLYNTVLDITPIRVGP